MSKKPFVVFVFPVEREEKSTRYAGFGRRLQKAGGMPDHEIVTVALENLAFITRENGEAQIIDTVSGVDIGDADFVYLKSWEALPEEACALANFLQGKGIPFMDTLALGTGVSKLATMFRLWGQGVAMPNSIYVRRADRLKGFLTTPYADMLGDRFIVKDIVGAKGKMNFLAMRDEVAGILEGNDAVHFVCQRYIPNSGDYRIGVYVDEARFAIKRVGSGNSHLNNTSAGGTAEYIPIEELDLALVVVAQKAAEASSLQVAGVDIIKDEATGQLYVLEVNQGSQIVTGAFVDENIKAFNEGLSQAIRSRYKRARQLPLRTIGRRSMAKIPEMGIAQITAKIDTGAYSSTLHADNIRIEKDAEGADVLVFEIQPSQHVKTVDGNSNTIRLKEFFIQNVRSSNGHVQPRYSFKTKLTVEGKSFAAIVTLSDRSQMGYPLLIGRRVLRSRFLVNVELNENNNTEWQF